jgi:cold shock CspA family protein
VPRSGSAKGPPAPTGGTPASGTIVRLVIGQSHGFIRLRNRREVFFHRSDMSDDTPFNALQVGDRVEFELIVDTISGSRAVRVKRPVRRRT